MSKFSSIKNFRDLGGYRTKDGRRIRNGLLLRSGSLVSANDEDLALLQSDYRLSRIFDLRSEYEVSLAPDRAIEGVSNTNLELLDLAGQVWKEILNLDSPVDDPMMRLIDFAHTKRVQKLASQMYIYLAGSPGALHQYRILLSALADETEGATLWHCSFGKDRTGVCSALILSALGCDREIILADYGLSNLYYKARVDHVIGMMEDDDENARMVIRTFLGANVDCFNAGLQAAIDRYGNAENYITEGLGLPASLIGRLKDKYLE